MIRIATTAALLATAGTALAQYEITFDIENETQLPGQSTTVTMYAGFDPMFYAMAGVGTNLITSVGSEGFSDAFVVAPMDGPGTSPGMPSATGWDGIIAGQLNFPATAGIYADPTNPIAFWEATYTAPTDVASPFDIDLSTMTTRYDIYISMDRSTSESRLAELVEGSGAIRVIPAPASALVLALGAVALRRRR
ncbi:MAG: hypothetical protein ACIAS6_06270 [Phycisphaerales bacterium JB060]